VQLGHQRQSIRLRYGVPPRYSRSKRAGAGQGGAAGPDGRWAPGWGSSRAARGKGASGADERVGSFRAPRFGSPSARLTNKFIRRERSPRPLESRPGPINYSGSCSRRAGRGTGARYLPGMVAARLGPAGGGAGRRPPGRAAARTRGGSQWPTTRTACERALRLLSGSQRRQRQQQQRDKKVRAG
jgi:hypothetical protein